MSTQTKINIQKLISAIAIAVTVFAGAVEPMDPVISFYLLAISNSLQAGLQIYFGITNPDAKPAPATTS